jgi:hypothetical protein
MARSKTTAVRTGKAGPEKSAASRSAKAKARPTNALPDPHPGYDYEVYVDVDNHVRVNGTNEGNIRGERGDVIRFTYVGRQLDPGFTITATELKKNKEKPANQKKQPFDHALPETPARVFHSALRSTPDKKPRIFKYTVKVSGATPADPVIIIDPF